MLLALITTCGSVSIGLPSGRTAFSRFPTWMWRNNEVRSFVDWLREYIAAKKPQTRTAFHGLDLYSLYDSIRFVLQYLDEVDPPSAKLRANDTDV
jgi:erythromycin esterase-like protein